MTEEKDLLRDFLMIYLDQVGFCVQGQEGPATEDEIEFLIDEYFRAPEAA